MNANQAVVNNIGAIRIGVLIALNNKRFMIGRTVLRIITKVDVIKHNNGRKVSQGCIMQDIPLLFVVFSMKIVVIYMT